MARYRLRDKVLLQKVAEEMVILDLLDGQYYGLDAVGARMLALVQEHGDCESVVAQLAREYEANDERLRGDLDSLMGQLREKGLVELVEQ